MSDTPWIDLLAARAGRRQVHLDRARELLAKAESWIDVDDETMNQRGYGIAQFWVQLAQLHLAIRELE